MQASPLLEAAALVCFKKIKRKISSACNISRIEQKLNAALAGTVLKRNQWIDK
jgi:hypothetical protein